jgi:hypothetical protein
MKNAFVDITLDALGDLLRLWKGTENLLKEIESSPLGNDHVRLLLSGDRMPDTFSEEPKRAKLYYEGSLTGLCVTICGGEDDHTNR